ncbi:MAG: ABC transporter ATP-binding protein [Bryobacteraceae bacterium]|nr:ABC transporter ATP-binding protein [Bryobacteraceae bacterium]
MNPLFELRGVSMRYDGIVALNVAELDFPLGQFVSVVGPNGAGKSTLLGIMAGLRPEYEGHCRFAGNEVKRWPRRRLAQAVSFVPQTLRVEFPFTAEQVVMMGRTPFGDGLFETPADHEALERALEFTDTVAFRHRDFRSLSGGERQRVVLASALAQDPQALLLDEPTAFLDVKHQLAVQRVLRQLCARGILVVAATHDLNLAAAFCDRVVVLHRGGVAADAAPAEALRAEVIRSVFEVEAILHAEAGKRPWIRYDA